MISLGLSVNRWSFAGFGAGLRKFAAISTFACREEDAAACVYPFTSVVFNLNIPSLDGRGNSTPLLPPVFFDPSRDILRTLARAFRMCVAGNATVQKAQQSTAAFPHWPAMWAVGLIPQFSNNPLNCERKTSHV